MSFDIIIRELVDVLASSSPEEISQYEAEMRIIAAIKVLAQHLEDVHCTEPSGDSTAVR
jgi:hypothetical protein